MDELLNNITFDLLVFFLVVGALVAVIAKTSAPSSARDRQERGYGPTTTEIDAVPAMPKSNVVEQDPTAAGSTKSPQLGTAAYQAWD